MNAPFNQPIQISDWEFSQIQTLIHKWAGISLGANKRPLVIGRLSTRLRHYGLLSADHQRNLFFPGTGPFRVPAAAHPPSARPQRAGAGLERCLLHR